MDAFGLGVNGLGFLGGTEVAQLISNNIIEGNFASGTANPASSETVSIRNASIVYIQLWMQMESTSIIASGIVNYTDIFRLNKSAYWQNGNLRNDNTIHLATAFIIKIL